MEEAFDMYNESLMFANMMVMEVTGSDRDHWNSSPLFHDEPREMNIAIAALVVGLGWPHKRVLLVKSVEEG